MKKQKMQLLLLGIILIIVLAAFLILRSRQSVQNDKEEQTASYEVISIREEKLEGFTVENMGEVYAFKKGENGWETDQRTADMLNQDTLEAMLAQITSLRADDRIEGVSDLSGFGLEKPEVFVTLILTDGTEYRLAFGDYNEMAGVYYLGLNGSDVAYTTPINIKGSFRITWEKVEN